MNLVKATSEPFDLLPIIHTLTRELLSVRCPWHLLFFIVACLLFYSQLDDPRTMSPPEWLRCIGLICCTRRIRPKRTDTSQSCYPLYSRPFRTPQTRCILYCPLRQVQCVLCSSYIHTYIGCADQSASACSHLSGRGAVQPRAKCFGAVVF